MTKIVDGVILRNSNENGDKIDTFNRFNCIFSIATIFLSLIFGLKGFLIAAVSYGMYRLTFSTTSRANNPLVR